MNLGVIFDIRENKPECVIIHDYENGNIGYSTYNEKLSNLIEIILNNDIYMQSKIKNKIICKLCDKDNPYYINTLNQYLPFEYKILWLKKINGNIDKLLEESYEILEN